MSEKVQNPRYRKSSRVYSDMGYEDYAVAEVLSVWIEMEEDENGEKIKQYYYKFKFINEHSPHEKGTIINKRKAENFEENWNPYNEQIK